MDIKMGGNQRRFRLTVSGFRCRYKLDENTNIKTQPHPVRQHRAGLEPHET